jgi:hypothetical protein
VNGHEIPGAPEWTKEFLDRVQLIVDNAMAPLVEHVRSLSLRVTKLEEEARPTLDGG